VDGQLFSKILKIMNMKERNSPEFTINKEGDRILISRRFRAPRTTVWNAWTKPELTDQWWAPKPWKVQTKEMNFVKGGYWLYTGVSPLTWGFSPNLGFLP
jgi:uncharacterized protein YndB with AHSA1/START domain